MWMRQRIAFETLTVFPKALSPSFSCRVCCSHTAPLLSISDFSPEAWSAAASSASHPSLTPPTPDLIRKSLASSTLPCSSSFFFFFQLGFKFAQVSPVFKNNNKTTNTLLTSCLSLAVIKLFLLPISVNVRKEKLF